MSFSRRLTVDGPARLFTCTCGDFGCGGYYVEVRRSEEAWIWGDRHLPDDEPGRIFERIEQCFAWPNVRAVADEIVGTLRRLHRERPEAKLALVPYTIDLPGRLPHYEEVARAIPADTRPGFSTDATR